jgi:hypothetical protein
MRHTCIVGCAFDYSGYEAVLGFEIEDCNGRKETMTAAQSQVLLLSACERVERDPAVYLGDRTCIRNPKLRMDAWCLHACACVVAYQLSVEMCYDMWGT